MSEFANDQELMTTVAVGIDGLVTIQVDEELLLTVSDPLPVSGIVEAIKDEARGVAIPALVAVAGAAKNAVAGMEHEGNRLLPHQKVDDDAHHDAEGGKNQDEAALPRLRCFTNSKHHSHRGSGLRPFTIAVRIVDVLPE